MAKYRITDPNIALKVAMALVAAQKPLVRSIVNEWGGKPRVPEEYLGAEVPTENVEVIFTWELPYDPPPGVERI